MSFKNTCFNYLKKHHLMSLASVSDKPWICILYYAVDKNLNLYCITDPNTQHAKEINKNPHVACAVYDSHQQVTDKKTGMQIKGKGKQITNVDYIKKALSFWNKANPGYEKIISYQNITEKKIDSQVFQITPERIKFFNEVLFGPEGYQELES